jgi:hypothetical protein
MQHQNQEPQNPFFIPIRRRHLNEKELEASIKVVTVRIWGDYTKRGEHRKEVITGEYDAEVEVPHNFNRGHLKLAANRYVKNELRGIRARHVHYDPSEKPKPVEHQRRVKDFMSWQGLRDNDAMKREYDRDMAKRKAEAEQMANGIAPAFLDETHYGTDGLPRFSEKTYVAQE